MLDGKIIPPYSARLQNNKGTQRLCQRKLPCKSSSDNYNVLVVSLVILVVNYIKVKLHVTPKIFSH